MKIRRRNFIGFSVGSATGVALGVPVSRTVSQAIANIDRPIYPPRGPEDFALSVCSLCEAGCGIKVRRVGGRPVKVDGNPLHPVNRGRLCPKGQAALQSLHHPDRITTPLRRVGSPGDPKAFEPRSWEECLREIGGTLKSLRVQKQPHALMICKSAENGVTGRVASRFLRAFGSPNDITLATGNDNAALATILAQGAPLAPVYDIGSTDYILSLGAALLEASDSPVPRHALLWRVSPGAARAPGQARTHGFASFRHRCQRRRVDSGPTRNRGCLRPRHRQRPGVRGAP